MLSVLLGLLPFAAIELALRWLEWPESPPAIDPYVDLHHLKPLFTRDAASGQLTIAPERMRLFQPASFPERKPSGTFRIFALGGSTTQGEPYAPRSAFPEWQRLHLEAMAPEWKFEVINCGGLSYASYRVLAILREVLRYDADLIVLYTGHNEYLERRSYTAYHRPSLARRIVAALVEFHTVRMVRRWFGPSSDRAPPAVRREGGRTALAAEVDALLDYRGGLDDYHRGDAWYDTVPEHFQWNLRQIARTCRDAGVPLIVVRPVSNLRDCPPFKFEPAPGLDGVELSAFARDWDAARNRVEDPGQAIERLRSALAIDPEHAGAHFLLGRMLLESGDAPQALLHLTAARDFDVCPLRAPTAILNAIDEVAREFRLAVVDAQLLFAQRSEQGIVGDRWLVDHIHPTVEGHQWLGEQLALKCQELLSWEPPDDWRERRDASVARHWASLDEAYFHRGKQRLEGLRLWTQGRAKKTRGPPDDSAEP